MTNNGLPWSGINIPEQVHDYTVRKIPDTNGVPLYWGRDSAGHCLFIVELSGDLTELYMSQHVDVRGMKLDLRLLDPSRYPSLVVSLEKHVDQDLFFAMCKTLISALHNISDPAVALSVAFSQIKRWKTFMTGEKRRILSAEEVRGLFGELVFFQQLLGFHKDEMDAVRSWEGPEGTHQDFIFNNVAVEVKAISGRERNSIQISSEDQLETLNDRLYLRLFRFTEMPDSEKAQSLNDLVRTIEEQFSDPAALGEFQDKLATAGYVTLDEYNNPQLITSDERTYLVKDTFPKIVRSSLSSGISKVRYAIGLPEIEEFIVVNETIWGQ